MHIMYTYCTHDPAGFLLVAIIRPPSTRTHANQKIVISTFRIKETTVFPLVMRVVVCVCVYVCVFAIIKTNCSFVGDFFHYVLLTKKKISFLCIILLICVPNECKRVSFIYCTCIILAVLTVYKFKILGKAIISSFYV